MFVRQSVFEKLVKLCESQHREIENLNEKLFILTQSMGRKFQFDVGKGWKLTAIKPNHNKFIYARREKARASDSSS